MRTSSKIMMGLTGALLVALGILCFCFRLETVDSLAWLLGLFILLAGIGTFFFWVDAHYFIPSSGGIFLTAVMEILCGILFLGKNLVVASILPYIFAFFVLVVGINMAIYSFDFKDVGFKPWWIILILGIGACVLGVFSFIKPMTVGTNAMSIMIGIAFILFGATYFVALFGVNKFERKVKKTVKSFIE